jgi:hypothetical protein
MPDEPKTETPEPTDAEWYDRFGDCISTALDMTAAQRWRAQGGQCEEGELIHPSARTRDIVDSAAAKLHAKDFAPAHEVLASQALVLDEIFNQFAGMAAKDPESFKVPMAIALKAQSQCRWTLKALLAVNAASGQPQNLSGQTIENGKSTV